MTTASDSPATATSRSIVLSARSLKLPLSIVLLFGLGIGAYYLLYVLQQRDYLSGRNFRLMATMGQQIEQAIESDLKIFANRLDRKRPSDVSEDSLARDKQFIPIVRAATIVRPAADTPSRVTLRFVERDSQTTWVVRREKTAETGWSVWLPLDTLLQPLLGDRPPEGTFETLIVAAADGRVIFQSGDSTLRVTNLATLVGPLDPKAGAGSRFEPLARAPGVVDVQLSGSTYKLFTQPCCGVVSEENAGSTGWVLAAITAQRTLRAESFSVPFWMMALLGIGMLLALLSWPFIKLLLIGESQRVRTHDVALVGICTLLGIGLITITVLDLYAYAALGETLDRQLSQFAERINAEVQDEVTRAATQLKRLERAVASGKLRTDTILVSDLSGIDPSTGRPFLDAEDLPYPLFQSFALVDAEGQQTQKFALGSYVTPRISVANRQYVTHWEGRTGGCEDLFFEAIQSATTGVREAVISKRACLPDAAVAALAIPMRTLINPVIVPGFGFVVIDSAGAVLFHSDPQHSLSENFFLESDDNRRLRALVAARRNEWVNVKYWADDHRAFVTPISIFEQPFTLVTMYDTSLARTVNIEWIVLASALLLLYASAHILTSLIVLIVRPQYRAPWLWPDPEGSKRYLGLLPPLAILALAFGVAIVALEPADLLPAAVLIPLLAWLLIYVVLARRREWRRLLLPGAAAVCLLAPLVALAGHAEQWMWRGVLAGLFIGSVLQTFMAARGREGKGLVSLPPPPNLSYSFAAGLFLLLVAVLPTIAFFRVGHSLQMENFIKYGQLETALDRTARGRHSDEGGAIGLTAAQAERSDALLGDRSARGWGIYDSFFFSTTPQTDEQAATCTGDPGTASGHPTSEEDTLPELIEELLPFYSESAVRMRELVHDRTADSRWRWTHDGDGLLFCSPEGRLGALRSEIPGFFAGFQGPLTVASLALLGLGALAVLGAVGWTIRFAIYNIFVADVIDPLWSGSSQAIADIWGPNLFLVSSRPLTDQRPPDSYCAIDLARAPRHEPDLGQWFAEQMERLEREPPERHLLFLHFDAHLDNPTVSDQRLRMLEHTVIVLNRTVVVVSAVSPTALTRAHAGAAEDTGRRWTELLSHFTIIPVMQVAAPQPEDFIPSGLGTWMIAGWREIVWRINALGFAYGAGFLESERHDPEVGRWWKEVLPYAWHPGRPPLDVGQLLVEVGERAEDHYRGIWATCTPAEKLVLGHIAQDGLVNRSTKRTVRRLLARGLVRREPHFVLLNETFRRFVLSSFSQTEVTALEGSSSRSAWDSVRAPFLAVLVASLTFLFITQHELFNTTLGVVTGVTAAIPALMKVASLFGDRRTAAKAGD